MRDEITADLLRRARRAGLLGVGVLVFAAVLYYALGCAVGMNARGEKRLLDLADDRWEFTECLYASAITVTTVGYTDLLGTELCREWVDAEGRRRFESNTDAHEDPDYDPGNERLAHDWSALTRFVTSLQVIMGMAFFLYVVAEATSVFAAGGLDRIRRAFSEKRWLEGLEDHAVIVGADVGVLHLVERLAGRGVRAVVVDLDDGALARVRGAGRGVPCILGDGTEEDVLRAARADRARVLICTVGDDRVGLVSTVVARQIRDDLRIVCRAASMQSARRLQAAGADVAVATDAVVGLRAASELIRPAVVAFLDHLLHQGGEAALRFEGLRVPPAWAGRRLADLDSRRRAGLDVTVLRRARGGLVYNPADGEALAEGDEVGVLGTAEDLRRLRAVLERPPEAAPAVDAAAPEAPRAAAVPEGDVYIVCGGGWVGTHAAREILASGRRLVVVEGDGARVEGLREELPRAKVVVGDALDPEVLADAGIATARGLVGTLATDRDNLVVAVTAMQARPGLRVAAVVRERRHEERLRRTGCATVSLGRVGVGGLAASALEVRAVGLLDRMREDEQGIRFEGIVVREGAEAAGRPLGEARLQERTGMRAVALRRPRDVGFVPHPDPRELLSPGTVVIVVGSAAQVSAAAAFLGSWE